jgi:hypothetical protein
MKEDFVLGKRRDKILKRAAQALLWRHAKR